MTEGGGIIQGFFDLVCGATAAQKREAATFKKCRNDLIDTINKNPECISRIPQSAIEYFNIHGVNGGSKGIKGGAF